MKKIFFSVCMLCSAGAVTAAGDGHSLIKISERSNYSITQDTSIHRRDSLGNRAPGAGNQWQDTSMNKSQGTSRQWSDTSGRNAATGGYQTHHWQKMERRYKRSASDSTNWNNNNNNNNNNNRGNMDSSSGRMRTMDSSSNRPTSDSSHH